MDRGDGGNRGGVDRPPIEALYRRYHDSVWRTLACLGVPEHAVDDAVQDVFLVVHRRLGDPEGYRSMKSWIYAVARRVALHHHRGRARHRRRVEALGREPSAVIGRSLEHAFARSDAAAHLRTFLSELEESQRLVFVLCELEGMTAPEVADIVKAKVSTVYSRLRLARDRFERYAEALESSSALGRPCHET